MALGVTAQISTGVVIHCDLTGGTTFDATTIVRGLVDINPSNEAPKQDKTQQIHSLRGYLSGLRTGRLQMTLVGDPADTDAGTTHAELYAAAIARTKANWQFTLPPGSGTGTDRFQQKGLIAHLSIPSILGQTVVWSLDLQLCGPPTRSYVT